MSGYNPFRTPNLTPQNTTVTSATGDNASSSNASTGANGSTESTQSSSFDTGSIPAEAPPAYTPIPDFSQGETPLEYGPLRPFQQSPQQPSLAVNTNISPSPTPSPNNHNNHAAFLPPPRHPSVASPSVASNTTGSDYPQRQQQQQQQQQASYLPPPGNPPSRIRGSNAQTAGDRPANDGRPTTVPTPGHPLLKNGRLLVYPRGYSCYKCHNTGYKSFDPSHPCRKCWEKYSRPFAGALTYAPFSPASDSSNNTSGNLQRPLPVFRPPHSTAAQRPHSFSGYPGQNHRLSGPPQPPQLYHSPAPPPPSRYPPGGIVPPSPAPQLLSPIPPPTIVYPHISPGSFAYRSGPPPPVPLVLPPGDPRIGGRLCWRCDGKGRISFLIFDTETCEVCRGIGRLF